ncbi:MAG: leucine-rich repeat domain-containing protein [Nostocales cyanobacterium W4_Combined_metabat2_030]|nr:leucine-rich repeat domain-containing protein [Nostocales cyanobacterium W4_Combined_metabat2_030]
MKKTFLLFASLSIVTIMQALTISNNTAGNLATAVGAELTTCTSLIVTGDIDARDFLTMKESMTALKTIDLSGATVIYYYGNGGTNGTSNQSYAPNDFPRNAFYYNTKLTSVILPNSITSIGNYAFDGCSSLTSVNIPSLVTSIGIGDGAFGGYSGLITVDTNNTKYSSVEGILYNKTQTTLIHCPPSKIGSVTILSSVNTINPTAFYKCISLTSITIPSLVNTIMDGAFNECRN